MALQPEYTFNNGYDDNITEFPAGSLYGGGECWNSVYSGPTQHRMYHFGKITHITPDQIVSLNPSIHTTPQTGLKIKLGTFSNGVEFGVSIWCIHFEGGVPYGAYTVDSVEMCGTYKKNNTYYYANDSGASPIGTGLSYKGSTGNTGQGTDLVSYACPINIVKTYGIKLAFNTDYAIGQGQAEAGVTKAGSFSIMAFVPCQASNNLAGLQSFNHIQNNGLYFDIWTDAQDPLVDNPQYFYYGYDYNQFTGIGYIFQTENLNNIKSFLNGVSPITEDPWKKGSLDTPTQDYDPSTPGGGNGNFDKDSDPIGFPSLPTGGALSSGAIKAFKVTAQNMTQVFTKLWDTSIFDIANFQKLTDSPLDNMISLQCIPISPHLGNVGVIKLGNFNTEVSAQLIDQEYYTIEGGTLKVEEFWGSALDYSPYTTAEIYVPMIGIRELDIDDIMGKTIHLKYNYSIFDGNLTAQLMCGNSVLYKWPGNVKETVPVTARVNDAIQRIVTGGVAALTAGTGAGMAAAAIGAAVNVAMSKTHVSRTGEISGSTGLLDDFEAYLILHRPIQSLADNFKKEKGYPSNISATLSSLSGYTEIEYIHLTGISGATDAELNEIESLLKSGVII